MAQSEVPYDEAVELCLLEKRAPAAEWQSWRPGAMQLAMGVVCDPPRRGLHVEIYIHRGSKVLRQTMDFTLFDRSSGVQQRVYQLTIADSNTPTHRERGEQWFGSHEHMGDRAGNLIGWDDASFEKAFAMFCASVNLMVTDGDIADPFAFKLQ